MGKNEFLTRLHASMEDHSFVKLTLGHAIHAEAPLRKLMFRPVEIRGERCCAVVSRFQNRDQTVNIPFSEALEMIESKLGAEFLSGHLFTETEEIQLQLGGPKDRLRIVPSNRPSAPMGHDRIKSRRLDSNSGYLKALGVTDSAGKIRMSDKFRQIERFVDLLDSAFRESDLSASNAEGAALTLCDMGCGKGYLTFAAYDFFLRLAKVQVQVTGVEARPELVRLCNRVAEESGFDQLRFIQSNIEEFPLSSLNILIALHACDTATDDALAAGIRAGASMILVAPCCQKEIRSQVDQSTASSPLRDLLRHGIFAERHAEMATDAIRVLLMERAGYRVRVCEFVAPEHTAKNIMLIATRKTEKTGSTGSYDRRISELKSFYGIRHHRLQQLLMAGCELGGASKNAGPVSEL